MVPRGGIQFSRIPLRSRHFSHDDFPVYPSMYPVHNYIRPAEKILQRNLTGNERSDHSASQRASASHLCLVVGRERSSLQPGLCEHGPGKARHRCDVWCRINFQWWHQPPRWAAMFVLGWRIIFTSRSESLRKTMRSLWPRRVTSSLRLDSPLPHLDKRERS